MNEKELRAILGMAYCSYEHVTTGDEVNAGSMLTTMMQILAERIGLEWPLTATQCMRLMEEAVYFILEGADNDSK